MLCVEMVGYSLHCNGTSIRLSLTACFCCSLRALQLRNQPGVALVVLEMVPCLSVHSLQLLAQAAAHVASTLGLHQVAAGLCSSQALKAAGKELASVCRGSLDSAIYT